MNYFEEGFASWRIISEENCGFDYKTFLKIPNDDFKSKLKIMLNRLENVLVLFEEFDLFSAKSFNIGTSEIKIHNTENIIYSIFKSIISNDQIRTTSVWCSGETGIYQKGELVKFDKFIRIGYEFFIDLISIDIFSDAWMPTSKNISNDEIEDAKINSLRLELVLRILKSKGFKIKPDEDEVYEEYVVKQKGFRLFYPDQILDNLDKKNIERLKEFILY